MKKFLSENKDYILKMFLVFGTNAFLYFIVKQFIPSYHLITLNIDDKMPLVPFFIMGRNVGIEPTHTGATIRRVNHFTNFAMNKDSLSNNLQNCKYLLYNLIYEEIFK